MNKDITIRLHGLGGQGVVTASEILAKAAFAQGLMCQSHPFFGVERTGSPVEAYVRLSSEPIRTRAKIIKPDYMIVIDPAALKKTNLKGRLKPDTKILLGSDDKSDSALKGKYQISGLDASQVAADLDNKKMRNIAVLGAFCRAYGLIKLNSLEKTIADFFKQKKPEVIKTNIKAARQGAKQVKSL